MYYKINFTSKRLEKVSVSFSTERRENTEFWKLLSLIPDQWWMLLNSDTTVNRVIEECRFDFLSTTRKVK